MKKILLLGLVAVMLTFGLVLASCSACPGILGIGKGNCAQTYSGGSLVSGSYKDCENMCLLLVNESSKCRC